MRLRASLLAHRAARGVLVILVLAGGLWVGGFAWFVTRTAEGPPPEPQVADGIVALTGGAGRVEAALRLLEEGKARKLLISGTNGAATVPHLAHLAGIDARPLMDRITLGRAATSTHGNAAETRDWAARNGVRSVFVVTSTYHMPRALAELAEADPDLVLIPWPVRPPPRSVGVGMVRLLAEEYTKWLAVRLGLSALEAEPPASVAPDTTA